MEPLHLSRTQSWLSWFIRGLMFVAFLTIIARLFELQIVKGEYYRKLSEENRIRRVPIQAPRGEILARGGEVLVNNREVKKKIVFDPIQGYEKTNDLTGASEDELVSDWLRNYKLGSALAHVSGYLGEVDQSEVGKVDADCITKGVRLLGTLTGRSGIEQEYECLLAGTQGEELVEIDSKGIKVRTLGRKSPIPGETIRTTIDYGLQTKIADIILTSEGLPKDARVAVIVTDTQGEVLALYSQPSYDPNIFVREDIQEIRNLLNNQQEPLFNRVIGGSYHPGSVFKPFVAVAALEEGKIDKDFRYTDTGEVVVDSVYGKFSYTNWFFTQYGGTEGEIDTARAIARSTDTFFYKVGEMVGVDKLAEWSSIFGFDRESGVDIPGEVAGLVPTPAWKERAKGERWFLGNTYHLSIGQGDITLTPIAVNSAVATIASSGIYCKPNLVKTENMGKKEAKGTAKLCQDLEIERQNLEIVRQGMIGACSQGGTGFTFFDFKEKYGVEVACKTGTAETDDLSEPHAWFVAFAPASTSQNAQEKAEIVATVLVENGGEGSRVAGPIVREIFNYWFENRHKE